MRFTSRLCIKKSVKCYYGMAYINYIIYHFFAKKH
jgi:hypothetical protein